MNYTTFTNHRDNLGNCAFCLHPLSRGQVLAGHENGGDLHPIHIKCAKELIKNAFIKCVGCQAPMNPLSLETWQDKTVKWIQVKAIKVLKGAAVGILLSGVSTLAASIVGLGITAVTGALPLASTVELIYLVSYYVLFRVILDTQLNGRRHKDNIHPCSIISSAVGNMLSVIAIPLEKKVIQQVFVAGMKGSLIGGVIGGIFDAATD